MNSLKKSQNPDCVVFDLDDTLYLSKIPHSKALKKSLSEIASILEVEIEAIKDNYLKARDQVKLRLGETAASHSRLLYFQRLLEMYSHNDLTRYALNLENLYWEEYINNIEPINNGLYELLNNIKNKGLLIAIVTDLTAQIQIKKIIKLGISNLIDYLVTSEEAGLDKPNFSCFSLLDEKVNTNCTPIKYWMVGNDVRKDLLGAKIELDATTFWLNCDGIESKESTYIDYEIISIMEINDYLF